MSIVFSIYPTRQLPTRTFTRPLPRNTQAAVFAEVLPRLCVWPSAEVPSKSPRPQPSRWPSSRCASCGATSWQPPSAARSACSGSSKAASSPTAGHRWRGSRGSRCAARARCSPVPTGSTATLPNHSAGTSAATRRNSAAHAARTPRRACRTAGSRCRRADRGRRPRPRRAADAAPCATAEASGPALCSLSHLASFTRSVARRAAS